MTELNTNEDLELAEVENWKPKVMIVATAIGALLGLGVAFLLVSRVEENEKLEVTPAQGIKMGLAGLTFLRQVTQLGD
jgi:type II secretory pathway component PulJ